jgi:hypothetical protein
MGKEAICTARVSTCWKELENVLEPLNVGEAMELVLEAINQPYAKYGPDPERPGPLNSFNAFGGLTLLQQLEN